MKLFSEWWASWSEADRDKMTSLFKEADGEFYAAVEAEMKGAREKLNEDFMIVNGTTGAEEGSNGTTNGETTSPPPVFNVTKVVVNSGPSSFTSNIEPEGANVKQSENGILDGEDDKTANSSENGEGMEPVATEI